MSLHRTCSDPLSPNATFQAMRTPDVQTPGPSASLVDTDETSGNKHEYKGTLRHPNQQLKEKHKGNNLARSTG
jgi:hypothetical protein